MPYQNAFLKNKCLLLEQLKIHNLIMSKSKSKKISELNLEGRLLGFVFEDDKLPKHLRLATAEGECWIKLSKELRTNFDVPLVPGDWVQVMGEKKLDAKTGKPKLKAKKVIPTAPSQPETVFPTKITPATTNILVCQKSDCIKRGGKAVCQALQAALGDRGLEDRVAVKVTGCMKKCSSGPNLIMPDKTRHSRVNASQISELLDKYFPVSI